MSEYYADKHKYDDIIHLPHQKSVDRARMSLHDRAAQFAPFKALSGHEEAIEETARLTEERILLDDTAIERINEKLAFMEEHISEKIPVSITYFQPEKAKSGGVYLTDIGAMKKIDRVEHVVIMESGMKISIEQIIHVEESAEE